MPKFPIWNTKQNADGHIIEKLAPGIIGHEAVNVSQLKPNRGNSINIVDNTAAPPTETTGDVYILDNAPGGVNAAWDGAAIGDIVEFDGAVWVATTPTGGDASFLTATGQVATYIDSPTPEWIAGTSLAAVYVSDYFVSADHGSDSNTGLSEINAFATLEAALDLGESEGVPFAVHLLDDSTYEVTEDSGTPGIRTTSQPFILLGNSATLIGQAGGVTWKTNSERIDGMNVDGTNLTFGLTGTGAGGQIDHLHRWFKIANPETLYKVESGDGSPHRYCIYFNRCKGTGSFSDIVGSSGQFAFMHIIGNDMGLDFNSGVTEYAFIGSGNQVIYNVNITQLDVTNPGAGDAKPFDLKSNARAFARFNCVGAPDGADVDTGARLWINAVTGQGDPLVYNDNGGAGTVYDSSLSQGMNFAALTSGASIVDTDLFGMRDVSTGEQVSVTGSQLKAYVGAGSGGITVTTVTNAMSPYAASTGEVIAADCTAGPITITYPAVAASNNGQISVTKIDGTGNLVTIDPNLAETVDGNLTASIAVQWNSRTHVCNGSIWFSI